MSFEVYSLNKEQLYKIHQINGIIKFNDRQFIEKKIFVTL